MLQDQPTLDYSFSNESVNPLKNKISFLLDSAVSQTGSLNNIVVSGFWRSGTTWLQQLLAEATHSKVIFEPLDRDAAIPFLHGKPVYYRGYIPPSVKVLTPADWSFLDRAFKGVSPKRSGFMYVGRGGPMDAFRKRVVVKFVRAQMILEPLIARYSPNATLHISRHPMSVIQSMLNANWDWTFDQINLEDWYSGTGTILDELAKAPLKSNAQKLAALWALTEWQVQSTPGVKLCRYETLITDPDNAFSNLMADAGLSIETVPNFKKDSPVTFKNRQGVSTQQRLNSWKTSMNSKDQDDIRSVLRDFWPDVDKVWDLE